LVESASRVGFKSILDFAHGRNDPDIISPFSAGILGAP
jgi:hypothetical protein